MVTVERNRSKAGDALVTVRIDEEVPEKPTEPFVTDDPAFGIWRDREDMADVTAYVRKIRRRGSTPTVPATTPEGWMLVDTDVLIWHLRGYAQATRRLDSLDVLTLSAISYLEIYQCIRNKGEMLAVKKMLEKRSARLLPATESITQRAIGLLESWTLSHGLQMGDALIAATAVEHQLGVLTANVKHFGAVPGLAIEPFTP